MKKLYQKITNWEQWNFFVLYFPLLPFWCWYVLKSRALWFFSASNPTITFGGFEGEGKREMYEQLPVEWVPKTLYIQPAEEVEQARMRIAQANFQFPFAVKPDVGMKGILFRKIDSWQQWEQYHKRMPAEYLVQELVELPLEISIFYYRHPSSSKGTISGMIAKELLQVKGDGISSLQQLIQQHPKASLRWEEMQTRHGHRMNDVIAMDEIFFLSYAGNHNRGARFTNLHHEIDEPLLQLFDQFSHQTRFYYGRYDIKTTSLQDLRAGRNSVILEFNGCGAEPNHIYDCGMGLLDAYRVLLTHWKALYEISAWNNANGTSYWPLKKGYHFLKASQEHFKKLEAADLTDPT